MEISQEHYFSTMDMLQYLNDFDYVKKKYLIDELDGELLEKLRDFENSHKYGNIQKLSPAYVGQTMNRVYGFSNRAKEQSSRIYSFVFNKIIHGYLNVNGLELLFNEHYYDFEWDMHLEFDVESSQYNYYRDHMEHQVRNMYMMLKMLEKNDLFYEVKKILSNRTNNKVANYVSSRHKEFVETKLLFGEQKSLFLDCSKLYYKKIIKEFIASKHFEKAFETKSCNYIITSILSFLETRSIALKKNIVLQDYNVFFSCSKSQDAAIIVSKNTFVEQLQNWFEDFLQKSEYQDEILNAYLYDYSFSYIIYSSTIISALFHDVSYPLCFSMNIQNRIGKYLPAMNTFINNVETDIDRIVSLLQPSLLFMLVSEKEIREKLAKNQRKYDHGIFSAIALLLSFYESGRINQLSIDKQIAIELAALAIYNHNFKYYILSPKNTDFYRPFFAQNPISFLLKICDDMQEWDRRYFELSKSEENFFCTDCRSPLILFNNKSNTGNHIICRCCEDEKKDYKKPRFFTNRNMYTVTTCRSIDVFESNNNLIFKFNYNLLELLHMTQINCTYARYRAQELNKLKKIMLYQKYSDDKYNIKIKNMFLDYYMSSNPLYLKSMLMLQYIVLQLWHTTKPQKNIYEFINDNINRLIHSNNMGFESIKATIDAFTKSFIKNIKEQEYNWIDSFSYFEKYLRVLFTNNFFKKIKTSNNHVLFAIYLKSNNVFVENILNYLKNIFFINLKDHYNIIPDDTFALNKWLSVEHTIRKLIDDKCNRIINKYFENETNEKKLVTTFSKKWIFYAKIAGYIIQSFINSEKIPPKDIFEKNLLDIDSKPYNDHTENTQFKNIINILINDVYYILKNQVNVYSNDIDLNKYTMQFEYYEDLKQSNELIYPYIEQYINPTNWFEQTPQSYNSFACENLDFYSDLYLFELLGESISNIEKNE